MRLPINEHDKTEQNMNEQVFIVPLSPVHETQIEIQTHPYSADTEIVVEIPY